MKRRPRVYVGVITSDEARRVLVVPLDGGHALYELPSRLDLYNHSPAGFAWGYGGSGPAQLALAILSDHLGSDAAAIEAHQDFKAAVVADLDGSAGFVITQAEIDDALAEIMLAKKDATA